MAQYSSYTVLLKHHNSYHNLQLGPQLSTINRYIVTETVRRYRIQFHSLAILVVVVVVVVVPLLLLLLLILPPPSPHKFSSSIRASPGEVPLPVTLLELLQSTVLGSSSTPSPQSSVIIGVASPIRVAPPRSSSLPSTIGVPPSDRL